MTAGISSLGWKVSAAFRTAVDSASPGSQATASFSWAPVSLLAGLSASPNATSQNATMTHLDTGPDARRARRPTLLVCRFIRATLVVG